MLVRTHTIQGATAPHPGLLNFFEAPLAASAAHLNPHTTTVSNTEALGGQYDTWRDVIAQRLNDDDTQPFHYHRFQPNPEGRSQKILQSVR